MSLPVKIVDYAPKWPQLFEDEKTLIEGATGHIVVRVEHIGSRAVCDLGAKPIIDILGGARASKAQHYHLHVVELMSDFWTRHLAFRDYLRAHSEVAHEYQQLKQRLAREHRRNREAYTEAKTPFIESVLAKARAERIHAGK